MAKLKAPLLSFGASGAIAKAVVYFPWKGLNCAREYVIPANPKTTAQNTQRGYLTDAVAAIHEDEARATNPLDAEDKTAYALYGSTFPTPRTWFNQIVMRWLLAMVHGERAHIYLNGHFSSEAAGTIELALINPYHAAQPGKVWWGTSKTALVHSVAANGVSHIHRGVATGLVKGVKYFFQFRPDKITDDKWVMRSGIYYHTQAA